MKRVPLLLALAATAALLWQSATPAQACSVGPDFDPVRDSDLVVGGRITGWEIIEGATRTTDKTTTPLEHDPNYYGPYEPVRFRMTVDRVYKGSASTVIEMVAGNTLTKFGDSFAWVGSSGACGAFDEDPTGKYLILGLNPDVFGRYRPSLGLVFYSGEEPPSDFNSPRLGSLAPLLPGSLPSGGGSPLANDSRSAVPIVAGVLLTALGAASFLFSSIASRT